MNDIPEIKEIDATMLTEPVRQALGSRSAEIRHWEHHPISYINTEVANLGLHRFKGIAREGVEDRAWSIVLKAVDAPINDTDPSQWNYHRREILAYEEGLLTDLPGGISAPRCLGITKYSNGVCWLWLEDVLNPGSSAWSLTEYGLVARNLGQFNGAYLTGHALPSLPWLSRHWLRGWLSYYETSNREALELLQDEHFWEQSLLRSAFPRQITDEVLHLWESHESLLRTLDRLPQTFCHLDAYRPNLFLHRDGQGSNQTVAVDWVFMGIASVGEEIANLLAASLIWLEYDATEARNLDEVIFNNYLKGLRDAGWQDDPRLARLGYTAACALRWGVVGLWWLRSLGDSGKQAELETHWNRPLAELVSQWARTTTYILGLAQEAYQLREELDVKE
ncbi:MAG TPA: phosphotransferase [Anaerolineales bacterium]